MPRTIVDLPTDESAILFRSGAWPPTRQLSCAHLDSRPAVVLAVKPSNALLSWAAARCHRRCYVGAAGRYFVCSCCCRRSIARAICSCSSAILVKPCSRKRSALARCHFPDFSSPGFSGLSSIDIGCPLEEVAQEHARRVGMTLRGHVLEGTHSRASVSFLQLIPLKLHLEAPFGFVHLMRHGRLRSVKFLCRRSETAAFNHLDESSELIEIEAAHGYKCCLLFPSK